MYLALVTGWVKEANTEFPGSVNLSELCGDSSGTIDIWIRRDDDPIFCGSQPSLNCLRDLTRSRAESTSYCLPNARKNGIAACFLEARLSPKTGVHLLEEVDRRETPELLKMFDLDERKELCQRPVSILLALEPKDPYLSKAVQDINAVLVTVRPVGSCHPSERISIAKGPFLPLVQKHLELCPPR